MTVVVKCIAGDRKGSDEPLSDNEIFAVCGSYHLDKGHHVHLMTLSISGVAIFVHVDEIRLD